MHADLGLGLFVEGDRLFLQYMIRHHEGAVAMVEQLLTEGVGGQEPQLFQLAQHIELDQQVEIARMRRVLTDDRARRLSAVANGLTASRADDGRPGVVTDGLRLESRGSVLDEHGLST
jgi:hypothetical protein